MSGGMAANINGQRHESEIESALLSLDVVNTSLLGKDTYSRAQAQRALQTLEGVLIRQCPFLTPDDLEKSTLPNGPLSAMDFVVKLNGIIMMVECKSQLSKGTVGGAAIRVMGCHSINEFDDIFQGQEVKPLFIIVEGEGFSERDISRMTRYCRKHNELWPLLPVAIVRSKAALLAAMKDMAWNLSALPIPIIG